MDKSPQGNLRAVPSETRPWSPFILSHRSIHSSESAEIDRPSCALVRRRRLRTHLSHGPPVITTNCAPETDRVCGFAISSPLTTVVHPVWYVVFVLLYPHWHRHLVVGYTVSFGTTTTTDTLRFAEGPKRAAPRKPGLFSLLPSFVSCSARYTALHRTERPQGPPRRLLAVLVPK